MPHRSPTWSLAFALGLCAACTGPGLEPPEQPLSPGVNGPSGSGGSGGSEGGSGTRGGDSGSGGATGAGGAGAPPDRPRLDGGMIDPGDEQDAGSDDGSVDAVRELEGPSYLGSVSNSAECSRTYATSGHEPATSGERHPLFLYFVGTAFDPADPSARHDSPAPLAVTHALARRGFVALSVQYDNDAIAWASDHANQLTCLFDYTQSSSLIARACALPNVDCEIGMAIWGHSQGGYIAAVAYNRDLRVSAVWATGYGGDAPTSLPPRRLRVVNGEADADGNGTAAKLNAITDLTPGQCPDPDQCLREDGSGWIIVRRADLAEPDTSSADHCWFDRPSCASAIALEPNWVDPASDKPFALELNADWLARRARE